MINPGTEFSDGLISAKSSWAHSANELWKGYFDFALLGASWDKRSAVIAGCTQLKFGSVVILKPPSHGTTDLLSRHYSTIKKYCFGISDRVSTIDSDPKLINEELKSIRDAFLNEIAKPNRSIPAKVFIDTSTCPRYFTLALLAEAFRSGLTASITLGYAEGKYPIASPSYNDLEEISFTEGALQAMPIPGFFGEFEPSKAKLFLVSLGFDGWKTLNLLIRKEPERVVALLASPASATGYEERALVANAALIDRFGLDQSLILKAPAGDAVSAWKTISQLNVEHFDSENVFYLCSGNKPHSIAFALRAMSKEFPALLYNRPERHMPVDIDVAGVFWSYVVTPVARTVLG